MDRFQVLVGLRMDVKVGLLVIMLVTISLFLVVMRESVVALATNGVFSLDPTGDLVRGMSQLVDVMLNVVLFLVSDAVLDSQILQLLGGEVVIFTLLSGLRGCRLSLIDWLG